MMTPKHLLVQKVQGRGTCALSSLKVTSNFFTPCLILGVLTNSQGAYLKRNVFEEEMKQLQERYSTGTLTESGDVPDLVSDDEDGEINFEEDPAPPLVKLEEAKIDKNKKVLYHHPPPPPPCKNT